MNEDEDKTSCELKDLMEMIRRYIAVNKNNVAFVGSFIAFKEGKCEDCGDEHADMFNDEASRIFAYGDIDTLRMALNELRDVVEDNTDKRGFVSI